MDQYYIYEIATGIIIQVGLCPRGSEYTVDEGFGFGIGAARPEKHKIVNGQLVNR